MIRKSILAICAVISIAALGVWTARSQVANSGIGTTSNPSVVNDPTVVSAIQSSTLTPPLAVYQGGAQTYLAWGGTTNAKLTSTAVAVNASPRTLTGIYIDNSANTAITYVQVFNVASTGVTLGTTVPTDIFQVPAGGYLDDRQMTGVVLATAVSAAATTTPTGSSAPGTAIGVTLYYK